MSEYFTVEVEPTDDPNTRELITNHMLAPGDEEIYRSREAGDEGSPLAQALFHAVDGITALRIVDESLFVTRDPAYTWEFVVDEIRDVLRDFFL